MFSEGQLACVFFFAPIGFCGSIMFATFAIAHYFGWDQ
jgi:hypothetical protein